MKLITKEVRIGIAGVAALCLLVFGINYLKGINMFKPASYFYVKFHNVNGLAQSSPVFADGVRVGIVRVFIVQFLLAEIFQIPGIRSGFCVNIPHSRTCTIYRATSSHQSVKQNICVCIPFYCHL